MMSRSSQTARHGNGLCSPPKKVNAPARKLRRVGGALKAVLKRCQNRVLSAMLTSLFDDLNDYSYPRGHQLQRAIRDDEGVSPPRASRGTRTPVRSNRS